MLHLLTVLSLYNIFMKLVSEFIRNVNRKQLVRLYCPRNQDKFQTFTFHLLTQRLIDDVKKHGSLIGD